MKKLILTTLLLTSSLVQAEIVEQKISTTKYNTFVFDKPYSSLLFGENAKVNEPIPLIGNKGFLLKLKPEQEKDFQLIVELKNGETVEFTIYPTKANTGYTYRRNRAGIYAEPEGQRARPSDKWCVDTIRDALLGRTPAGFMEGGKPEFSQIGDTQLLPVQRFTNDTYELLIFEMRSETAKEVQPRDFWYDGVEAIQIEGDIVSPNHRPIIFILRGIEDHG